jgi:hypothetical protein
MMWDHIRVFETIEEVVDYLNYDFVCNRIHEARVLDLYDRQRVDPDLLWNIYYRRRAARRKAWDKKRWGKYEFRNGPVKGTSRKRAHRGSYMRTPKTKQERSEVSLFESYEELKDLNIRIRGRRKHLPTNWDDMIRADYYDRNWKRHRKTQYKQK